MKKMLIFIIALFSAYIGTLGVCAAFPPGYYFEQSGTGFAALSNEQSYSPNTSVKMGTVTTSDRSAIVFNGGPQLNTITQLSYWSYSVAAGDF